jgi:hypothetical protein
MEVLYRCPVCLMERKSSKQLNRTEKLMITPGNFSTWTIIFFPKLHCSSLDHEHIIEIFFAELAALLLVSSLLARIVAQDMYAPTLEIWLQGLSGTVYALGILPHVKRIPRFGILNQKTSQVLIRGSRRS